MKFDSDPVFDPDPVFDQLKPSPTPIALSR